MRDLIIPVAHGVVAGDDVDAQVEHNPGALLVHRLAVGGVSAREVVRAAGHQGLAVVEADLDELVGARVDPGDCFGVGAEPVQQAVLVEVALVGELDGQFGLGKVQRAPLIIVPVT